MLGVCALIAIDLIILTTYTLVEGIRGNLVVKLVAHTERPMDIDVSIIP